MPRPRLESDPVVEVSTASSNISPMVRPASAPLVSFGSTIGFVLQDSILFGSVSPGGRAPARSISNFSSSFTWPVLLDLDAGLLQAAPWGLAMNSIVYMWSAMAMPATFAQAGWTWGTCFLVYSTVATYYSGMLLGEICLQCPHLPSYPDIAEAVGGRVLKWISIVLQFLTLFLSSTAQLLFCAQYLGQLFPHYDFSQSAWLWTVAVAAMPLMQIPTYNQSRWVAVFIFAILVLTLAAFAVEAVQVGPWHCTGSQKRPEYPPSDFNTIGLAGTAFAYAFGGHATFPEEMRELLDKSQWNRVVLPCTYGIVVPAYVVSSYLGYYVWGGGPDGAMANINANFPPNMVNIVSIVLQFVQCYYCIFITTLCPALNIEIAIGADPSGWISNTSTRGILRHWPPVVTRALLRSLLVFLQLLLCLVLAKGEGDIILAVNSLSGAVGMAAFTYFLPYIFHWAIFKGSLGLVRRIWYIANICIGISLMAGGAYSSVAELVNAVVMAGSESSGSQIFSGEPYQGCSPKK